MSEFLTDAQLREREREFHDYRHRTTVGAWGRYTHLCDVQEPALLARLREAEWLLGRFVARDLLSAKPVYGNQTVQSRERRIEDDARAYFARTQGAEGAA